VDWCSSSLGAKKKGEPTKGNPRLPDKFRNIGASKGPITSEEKREKEREASDREESSAEGYGGGPSKKRRLHRTEGT